MYEDSLNLSTATDLDDLLPGSVFAPIDLHFARLMAALAGTDSGVLRLSAALVSRLGREGHTCLDLNGPVARLASGGAPAADLPSPGAWISCLKSFPVVGAPGDYRPLILDEAGRLYLHRSFTAERLLAERLLRMNAATRTFDEGLLKDGLERLFLDGEPARKAAAVIAASRSLCVITGGPGTGKTTLVAKILVLLLEQDPGLKIALAAPTGKAARRIEESITRGMDGLDASPEIKALLPREASTIHRLIGFSPGTTRPAYHAGRPLGVDVAVIDEASMADLALMNNLAAALKEEARLILLGDRNQLASVAAGYVLGDICDVGRTHACSDGLAALVGRTATCTVPAGGQEAMQDSLVELSTTYRFAGDSPIHRLSIEVNEGNAQGALEILGSSTGGELCAQGLPEPAGLRVSAREAVLAGYGPYLGGVDAAECLRLFEGFRILCPVREGPYGVGAMNRLASGILAESGLIVPGLPHYHGRPVLITENDYGLRLFNGDVGIILQDASGELRACFPDRGNAVRMIAPSRLPGHETAWAMTVHKSQGSEFDRVLLVMPDRDSPVLTRELVYTGITRARTSLEIWADTGVFASAVGRKTERSSGLRDLLWGTPG